MEPPRECFLKESVISLRKLVGQNQRQRVLDKKFGDAIDFHKMHHKIIARA